MSFQRVPLLLPWEPVEVRTTTFLSYVRISALVRFGSRRTEMGAYSFFFFYFKTGSLFEVRRLLKYFHFQPYILSKFFIHQQNKEERTLKQVITMGEREGELIQDWALLTF